MIKSKSIESQLNQAIAYISGIGLLIAVLSYIAIDSYFYKKSLIAEIDTLTSVTAHTAIGAVSFYDKDAAKVLLKVYKTTHRSFRHKYWILKVNYLVNIVEMVQKPIY